MLHAHELHSICNSSRLFPIQTIVWTAGLDSAEPARPCADIPEDHKRRRSGMPALPHIRASRFFAHRVKPMAIDDILQLRVLCPTRNLGLEPLRTSQSWT